MKYIMQCTYFENHKLRTRSGKIVLTTFHLEITFQNLDATTITSNVQGGAGSAPWPPEPIFQCAGASQVA